MPSYCLPVSLFLVLASARASYGQAADAAIAAITAEYHSIWSSRATYKIRSIDLDGESSEGGTAAAYYDGKALKLITVVYYGEMGKWEARYYYRSGQVFFALSSAYRYNRPIYYDQKAARSNGDTEMFDLKKSEITENRYYFQRGRLISWLGPAKRPRPVAAAATNEDYRELLAREASVRAELAK